MQNEDFIEKLKELILSKSGVEKDDEVTLLFKIFLFEESKGNDTADLFNLLGMESFCRIVEYFNGKRIQIIPKRKLDEIMRTAVIFYEVELNRKNWKEIREMFPDLKIDANAERFRIKKLKNILGKNLKGVLYE